MKYSHIIVFETRKMAAGLWNYSTWKVSPSSKFTYHQFTRLTKQTWLGEYGTWGTYTTEYVIIELFSPLPNSYCTLYAGVKAILFSTISWLFGFIILRHRLKSMLNCFLSIYSSNPSKITDENLKYDGFL